MVLRRWFWLVSLAALTGVAFFFASGLSQLLGSALLGTPPVAADTAAGPRPRPLASTRTRRHHDTHSILSRNIFDSTVGSLIPQAGALTASSDGGEGPSSNEPPRCGSDFRLVSTVVSDDPSWSFAAIGAGGKTLLYRVGGRVNEAEVTRITWRYAFLRPSGGSECYIGMFVPAEEAGAPRVATTSTTSTTTASSAMSMTGNAELDSAIETGVQKVSESEYNVDRSLVDRLLENQASLMRSARILPHEENGAVVGFKIYGVRRNSLLGKIGLQNGDIVHAINSFDMTSPDKALEAYARLRNADHLTVSVTRRGQRTNMDYNIR